MSNHTETTEEAVSALRRYADFVQKHSGEITIGHDALREYADRIESAVRRDRDFAESLHLKECIAIGLECEKEWKAKIGNRAAQRKALVRIATLAEWCAQEDWREEASKIARDTLKEPARNCDVSRDTKETIERCLASLNVESSSASFDAGVCAAIGWMLAAPEGGKNV